MHAKEAHVETETDKVTQCRVAPTGGWRVLVITVFTFPRLLSCLFIEEQCVFLMFFIPVRSFVLVFDVNLTTAEMQTNGDADARASSPTQHFFPGRPLCLVQISNQTVACRHSSLLLVLLDMPCRVTLSPLSVKPEQRIGRSVLPQP